MTSLLSPRTILCPLAANELRYTEFLRSEALGFWPHFFVSPRVRRSSRPKIGLYNLKNLKRVRLVKTRFRYM